MPKLQKNRQRSPKPEKNAFTTAEKRSSSSSSHHDIQPHNNTRETIESLAIAFMLAFFIRTFVVEAFVIPTGSMSPTLLGAHKDLHCPQCGQRFQVNASEEGDTLQLRKANRCVAGMCPMCRYTVPLETEVAHESPEALQETRDTRTYGGDRIVVNKFLYSFRDPQRWDVVVFKYPGGATDNYIKRLVGLPEETLRIYHGDLYVQHHDSPSNSVAAEEGFAIERKPSTQVLALRQPVHDSQREAAKLYQAGWPLRWQPAEDSSAWSVDATVEENEGGNVQQQFQAKSTQPEVSWLRYHHYVPTEGVWPAVEGAVPLPQARRKLVADFNSYNTRVRFAMADPIAQRFFRNKLVVATEDEGMHWVGDLLLEADITIENSDGALLLELVEAGHRFQCRLDVATGTATLGITPWQGEPIQEFAPTAKVKVQGPGKHRLLFANVDDQLLLWVDDELVEFDSVTTYNWERFFGPRAEAVPRTSENDLGDLSPAGIGTSGVDVTVNRLQLWRDIYYIAADSNSQQGIVTDYPYFPPPDFLFNPAAWKLFQQRQAKEFPLGAGQYFVMGDNSPQSSDARLWLNSGPHGDLARPGGNYLERQLLIGRAISVVWPHPWYRVVPNVGDMRRIR